MINPKWSKAFIDKIERETGQRQFTHVTAVTKLIGEREPWENYPLFCKRMENNPIRIIELREMLDVVQSRLDTTLAGTELGRILQLLRAAGIQI